MLHTGTEPTGCVGECREVLFASVAFGEQETNCSRLEFPACTCRLGIKLHFNEMTVRGRANGLTAS